MESVFNFICEYSSEAHWILFGLLLLSGFSIPVSEDFLILIAGAIAHSCLSDSPFHLYAWVFAGAWLSAWEAYWIGRLLGPKLYTITWFKRFINPAQVDRLHYYYEKFGVFTFIVGRFCPGGIRNALFMSSGLCRMYFLKFILRDGFACLLSTSTLFYLGYLFSENYKTLIHYIKQYDIIFLTALITLLLIGMLVYLFLLKKTAGTPPDDNAS